MAEINIAKQLLAARHEKKITQEELASYVGVSKAAVSKWESGISVPDSGMLISLAEELDTSVSVLLGENIQKPCPDDELNLKVFLKNLRQSIFSLLKEVQ